jgi:hypothetical protein
MRTQAVQAIFIIAVIAVNQAVSDGFYKWRGSDELELNCEPEVAP